MRRDIVPGSLFPDYELSDHAGKHRTLSELQEHDPMMPGVIICKICIGYWFFGRPRVEDLPGSSRGPLKNVDPIGISRRPK